MPRRVRLEKETGVDPVYIHRMSWKMIYDATKASNVQLYDRFVHAIPKHSEGILPLNCPTLHISAACLLLS